MKSYMMEMRETLRKSVNPVQIAISQKMTVVSEIEEAMKEVLEKREAYIENGRVLKYMIAKHFTERDGSTRLYVGREQVLPAFLGWLLPHDAPYKTEIDQWLMTVVEDSWIRVLELARSVEFGSGSEYLQRTRVPAGNRIPGRSWIPCRYSGPGSNRIPASNRAPGRSRIPVGTPIPALIEFRLVIGSQAARGPLPVLGSQPAHGLGSRLSSGSSPVVDTSAAAVVTAIVKAGAVALSPGDRSSAVVDGVVASSARRTQNTNRALEATTPSTTALLLSPGDKATAPALTIAVTTAAALVSTTGEDPAEVSMQPAAVDPSTDRRAWTRVRELAGTRVLAGVRERLGTRLLAGIRLTPGSEYRQGSASGLGHDY
ncbi:hypothetical protein O3P69_014746 [Scylla paramamosain]|uniref:Uncharacterized protein n=1 Tax=Scylla paramamosain TaxID=85552 RepID=A0AAW0TXP7_SCYPA